MTDERYTFYQDVNDKKRTARGAHNKVTRGGRIKMPYDYLTRKEKANLNGECVSYNLSDKLNWDEFKAMPTDIQAEYIDRLRKNGASASDIYSYLGVAQRTFANWQAKSGVHFRKGVKTAANKAKWELFLERGATPDPEANPATTQFDITEIIKALAGTGAKLTIEITL